MKINKPNLLNSEVEYEEDFISFVTDNKMSHTLSQLLGLVQGTQQTKLVRVDSDGVLLVNTEGSIAENLSPSQQDVTTTAVIIVAERSNRNSISIRNLGANTIYIGQDDTVAVASGFPIDANSVKTIDNYIGALYGIASSGTNDIRILEVY